MHKLSETLRQFVEATPNVQRVVVAFSGGVDSTVLLHAAVHASLKQSVSTIHVNHQLSANANAWQAHCEQVTSNYGVSGLSLKVEVNAADGGLEQAAREARLSAMLAHLEIGDLLILGHHAQDQVETFFLRLARGAGLRGLSAIPKARQMGPAVLGRPFLTISKSEIDQYARANNLAWIEDESNGAVQFDRNFLRLQVIPSLLKRWPVFIEQVSKTTELLREEQDLLAEYAEQDLNQLGPKRERVGHSIDMNLLSTWTRARKHAVIRRWLQGLGYRCPSRQRLSEIKHILTAAADKTPLLDWGDCQIRRYRARVYCLPKNWTLAQLSFINAEQGIKGGLEYKIIYRHELPQGLRCRPQGRNHSQTLKKLLQEYSLEPWLRESIPLVMVGDKVAAVGDLWVESEFYTAEPEAKLAVWGQ